MEDVSDISPRALRSLSPVTISLLSNLLNSTKVLPYEGRSRDWRGIAALTGVSAEVEANIWSCNDKFGKVLDLWIESQGGTVGELLQHLITLDRYDVYEDVVKSIREQIQLRPDNQVAILSNNQVNNNVNGVEDYEMITFEDMPGRPHHYHAYILSADEDHEFTLELRKRLTALGFELCSKENLRPGFASQFPPVAKLIAERCQRVILIYSPHFLTCRDNSFLRDYTQAISIQQSSRSMIPIVYRECDLPVHLRLYTMLRYNHSTLRNFWERLVHTLDTTRTRVNGIAGAPTSAPAPAPPRAPAPPAPPAPPAQTQDTRESSTHSAVVIETMSASVASATVSSVQSRADDDGRYFLNITPQHTNNLELPDVPETTPRNSTQNLVIPGNSLNLSHSTSSVSLAHSVASGQNTIDPLITNKKKPGKFKGIFNHITGRSRRKKEKLNSC